MKATTLNKLSTITMVLTMIALIAVFVLMAMGEGYWYGIYADVAFVVLFVITFILEMARLSKE